MTIQMFIFQKLSHHFVESLGCFNDVCEVHRAAGTIVEEKAHSYMNFAHGH